MHVSSPSPITISRLEKTFGRTRALAGLDLHVRAGEVHGFLGPNGAGKSTTLRILLGLVRPTSGTVRVFGMDPWAEPVRAHRDIAYVPGDVTLWPNLTGGEVIDLLAGLRGGADGRLRRELIEEFEFDPGKKARTYSKGNRQKTALIAAFCRPARLYLLDEPSSGLDPVMDAVFRRHVRRVVEEGATVLLSSHILAEVEQLCDRVTLIRSGTAVESGTLTELRHLTRTRFRVTSAAGPEAVAAWRGIHNLRSDGAVIEFDADAADLGHVMDALASAGITGISAAPPSLEELLMRHYGGQPSAGRDSQVL
ncbi:ATP-binding cassette domain-containing protein [Pseudarthrobacter enclensis]|uniref:ABC transporter ATP-binding protein n=1 Tax=Pseudarthrobacter enclensis TaxID=993070 RepID=UPI003EDF04B4